MSKTKPKTRPKPTTRELAVRKTRPVSTYEPPPPPPRYRYDDGAPALDAQTRHTLTELAESVKTFKNLEARITDLSIDVRKAENRIVETPDAWWHHLKVSISALQKEFKDRIPTLELQCANQETRMEYVLARMERLEQRIKQLEARNLTNDGDTGNP